jgi:hypothetical protein
MIEALITNFPVLAAQTEAKETEPMAFFEKFRSEYSSNNR